tara:strand:- start:172827 stop:174176 length:1350 start_codon:yes stop_codon:yes gene_type:complete
MIVQKVKVNHEVEINQEINEIEKKASIQSDQLSVEYTTSKAKRIKKLKVDLNTLIKKQSRRNKSIVKMLETEADIESYLVQLGEQLGKDIKLLSPLQRRSLHKNLKKYNTERSQFENTIDSINEKKSALLVPLLLKKRIIAAPEKYVKNDLQLMLANVMTTADFSSFLGKAFVVKDALGLITEVATSELVATLNVARSTNGYSLEGLMDYQYENTYINSSTGQIDLNKIFGNEFDINQLASLESGIEIDSQIKSIFGIQAYENLKQAFGFNTYQAIARLYTQMVVSDVLEHITVIQDPESRVLTKADDGILLDSIYAEESLSPNTSELSSSLMDMLDQLGNCSETTVAVDLTSASLPSWAPSFLLKGYMEPIKDNKPMPELMQNGVDVISKDSSNEFQLGNSGETKQRQGVKDLVKLFEHMQQQNKDTPTPTQSHFDRMLRRSVVAGVA